MFRCRGLIKNKCHGNVIFCFHKKKFLINRTSLSLFLTLSQKMYDQELVQINSFTGVQFWLGNGRVAVV